jgi:hypothetical protein
MALKGGDLVTCSICGRTYELTPLNDYFGATNTTDGKCESCLLKGAGLKAPKVLNPELGQQMEAEHRAKKTETN